MTARWVVVFAGSEIGGVVYVREQMEWLDAKTADDAVRSGLAREAVL